MPHKDTEARKQYAKQYRQDHKEERYAEKTKQVKCECGGNYLICHKARHFRTKLHQSFTTTKTN